MLRKATALPLCSITDILWYIYVVLSGSLVIVVIRLPGSSMNSADCGHQTPLVSMATGTKECVAARATYYVVLLTAAFSAAAQAVVEVRFRCDAAYVSGTVTSQASGLPRVHGTRVASLLLSFYFYFIIIIFLLFFLRPQARGLQAKNWCGAMELCEWSDPYVD